MISYLLWLCYTEENGLLYVSWFGQHYFKDIYKTLENRDKEPDTYKVTATEGVLIGRAHTQNDHSL